MAVPRILVIHDDRPRAAALRRVLARGGYEPHLAHGGLAGLRAIVAQGPAAAIVDEAIRDPPALELCRRVRHTGNDLPLLLLGPGGSVADRVAALDAGADDRLAEPVAPVELLARLRALLRRAGGGAPHEDVVASEEVVLDHGRHAVRAGERPIDLTPTEFSLLEVLLRHAERVLPPEFIYQRVWGYDFGRGSNTLRVYVGYLRRKLAAAGARPVIHTVRGVGYVLRAR